VTSDASQLQVPAAVRGRPVTIRTLLTLAASALALLGVALAAAPAVAVPLRADRNGSLQNLAVDRTLPITPFITAGGRARRDVALTFDDGPSEWTPRIAAELRRLHAPATFFEIGEQVPNLRAETRRLVRRGFPVGDHTVTHPLLAHHHHGFQHSQLIGAANAIAATGAPYPRLFRPPYGSFNATTLRILHKMRMLMVLWTNDTEDYASPGVRHVVNSALADLHPGAVILMHDGGGDRRQTVAALPLIVHALRARGYRLVTIPQMLVDDPPSPHQRIPDGTGPSATSS
jgi:peptidoglycan/xylan/chitin deacetylase (PgdA/CDA1 family)